MKRIDPILSGTEIDRLDIAADRIEESMEEIIREEAVAVWKDDWNRRRVAEHVAPALRRFLFDHFRLIRR